SRISPRSLSFRTAADRSPAACSSPGKHRESLPPPDSRRVRLLGIVPVDLPRREPLQHLFQRDAAFETRQRGTEAEVDAVTERQVVVDLAGDVEAVAVREAALVAVG